MKRKTRHILPGVRASLEDVKGRQGKTGHCRRPDQGVGARRLSMYRLVWTAHFMRSAKKFKKRHPELRTKLAGVLRDLEKDPFQPHLKYHRPGGKPEGIQAVSITNKQRISLTIVIAKKEITLLDIGTHDEIYRRK
ncbi:MAG: hypothetical protein U0586_10305 [Candidatus Brocadiaceae bacterium]